MLAKYRVGTCAGYLTTVLQTEENNIDEEIYMDDSGNLLSTTRPACNISQQIFQSNTSPRFVRPRIIRLRGTKYAAENYSK